MPIPIRAQERGAPGAAPGGPTQYYVKPVIRSRVEIEELAKSISQMCSLSRPDVHAMLEALTVLVPHYLSEGRLVSLGGLGTLRIGLKSGPVRTHNQVNSGQVKVVRALFNPAKELRGILTGATFEKVT